MSVSASAVPITGGMGPGGIDAPGATGNLQLWLKADGLSAGSITTWSDISGKANNATSTGTAAHPVVVSSSLNNLATVRFDGTDRYMSLPTALGTTLNTAAAGTGFIVFVNRGNSGTGSTTRNAGAWSFGTSAQSNHFGAAGAAGGVADDLYDSFGNSARPFIGDYVTPTTPAIGPNLYTASSASNTVVSRVDGVERQNTSLTTVFSTSPAIGNNVTASRYNGDVAEVVVLNRNLNTAERVVVENYLSAKWNTTLLTGSGALDVYLGDDPGKGNYDFDVFGVGALASGSTAISTGAAGFGLEASGGLDSGEFLMAGHDGTSNTIVSVEDNNNPNIVGSRWGREWYIDKTGALDATIAFDFEDAGLATPMAGSTFHLLYSANSNFADGWQILAETNTITSGTVAFNLANALLLDGYYTLGLNIGYVPEPNSMTLLLGILGLGLKRRRKVRRPVVNVIAPLRGMLSLPSDAMEKI